MTAVLHIARRTTQPHTGWRGRWDSFRLRHSRRAQSAVFRQLHDALPLDHPDRHTLDAPTLEAAFARLAAEHPETVTPADGGTTARTADREQLLLAACDAWFRDIHGPEHRWSPRTFGRYRRLLADVHSCFHPGSTS